MPLSEFLDIKFGDYWKETLNDRLLAILSTNENVNLLMLGFQEKEAGEYYAMITPIEMSGERLGTVFQYGTTVVGLEMLRSVKAEDLEESHSRQSVDAAMAMLSVTELEAVGHVFREIKGTQGLLVASRLAEETGITRSVIVNALRKLASAGILEVHSAGKKGTSITVLNNLIFQKI